MKNLFLILICCYAFTAFAQKPDVAVGKASYDFTHVRDTLNRDKPFKERLVLLVGRNGSVYKSLDKQLAQEKMAKDMQDQIKKAANPNQLALTITGGPPTSAEEYYQYTKDKKLYVEENVINYYLVEQPLPAIKWAIKTDTMSFGTLHCQKATTHFLGRDYTAWFCPDLPFQNGPWKLNGLPGLILEASDSKQEVIFKFAGFEDFSASNQTIAPPADDIKVKTADLERLKETRKKDPQGFAMAARGAGQARRESNGFEGIVDPSRIASINVKGYSGPLSKTINNPIELPEKK